VEPVEDRPADLCEQSGHEVFEGARILKAPDADRLESGVADQLLGQLPSLDVSCVQDAWPNPLFGDLIEEIGEGGIERLRDWTVGVRLHLVCERLVLLVPSSERVGGVYGDLALETPDLGERF
jgi:hypothetical protein